MMIFEAERIRQGETPLRDGQTLERDSVSKNWWDLILPRRFAFQGFIVCPCYFFSKHFAVFFFHDAPMVLHVFLECFHLRCHAIEAVFQKIALERCSSRSAVTSYTGVGSEGARQSRLCLVWLEGRCPTPSYHTFDLELPEDQRHQSMFHMRAAQKHCFKLQPLRDLGSKGSFSPG